MLGSHPIVEVRYVEMNTLDTGRRIDGHGKHLTPLDGIAQVGIRFDERLFDHGATIAQRVGHHHRE